MTVVLVPDHFYNCPICGAPCIEDAKQALFQVFLCNNPLVNHPLHYYTHIVEKSTPHRIARQEFSLDLGPYIVLYASLFKSQKTVIKSQKDVKPLMLDFIISPDFPDLNGLKKKVRTSITFS